MVIALYSIILALSLLLPIGYFLFLRKGQKEPWLLVLFIAVCIVNLGYLLLSLSHSVTFALAANKIAYFGQVFVPLCMFMLISKLSGFKYKKWVTYVLLGLAMVMFALVLTTGHLDWYYKNVELEYANGAARLDKDYGVLHPTNLIYVLSYFAAMIVVIIISLARNKSKKTKFVGMMIAVVVCNIGGWIVEKLVAWNFEFLSASYLMSDFVFLFVYWMMQDYVHKSDIPIFTPAESKQLGIDIATMPMDVKIGKVLLCLKNGETLAPREREVLELILQYKKRREIAEILYVSESSVKLYTRTLYSKLGVSCREELYAILVKK